MSNDKGGKKMTMRSFADHVIAVSNDVTGGITNYSCKR